MSMRPDETSRLPFLVICLEVIVLRIFCPSCRDKYHVLILATLPAGLSW